MIGSVGPGLSRDLLVATGRYAGPLRWEPDRPTGTADKWLESKFPQWTRSILQGWIDGVYDHLDTVVFSRADDSAQRLYYYLCELRRTGQVGGPNPLLLDIGKVPRGSSLDHTAECVRALAAAFDVADDALEAGIVETNRERQSAPSAQPDGATCLLIGTPPPDGRLHDVIAASGFVAVGATLPELWADPGPQVEEASGDPAAAIARQLHGRPDDQRGFGDQAASALAGARAVDAQAAVL